jgi:hypothetical protein
MKKIKGKSIIICNLNRIVIELFSLKINKLGMVTVCFEFRIPNGVWVPSASEQFNNWHPEWTKISFDNVDCGNRRILLIQKIKNLQCRWQVMRKINTNMDFMQALCNEI